MKFTEQLNAVAIDGPAGSGKSTISKLVAEKLGFTYIDTGAMYRALTLKVMEEKIDFSNEEKIINLSKNIDIKLLPARDGINTIKVLLDGKDVSEKIRAADVTRNVKYTAKLKGVRENLVALQRLMAEKLSGVVMEGRDITTVVLPTAKYKIYLDASFEERVKRRLLEFEKKGEILPVEELEKDLEERDNSDFTRDVGPLKKAEGAIVIDTTNLSISDVVTRITDYVKKKL
ncbi:cytidylate kinase [Candidatus Omnitrophus magneticus]|uniref:Cytidylate kinase n=1 Tax=Candidatus Omnitrophus magneticus TaxID=1609969 RepID=A0A0F0CJM7_9BACT|nr:cytidylate kinase [Candidatus Omnitrophus magneticus]